MRNSIVRPAEVRDLELLAQMRCSLWPDGSDEEHRSEAERLIGSCRSGTLPAQILVAEGDDGEVAGFIEVALRSHADGCDVAHPVGYIEGWFVSETARGQGLGRALAVAAEDWARAQGCVEMASDALISNGRSQQAHSALGYEVVDRCVHYRKRL